MCEWSFEYQGEQIGYTITDDNRPIRREKMSRYIHFYRNGKEIGFRAIYGSSEELTNITPAMAKVWYIEMIQEET